MEKKPKQGIIVIRKVIRTSLSIAAADRSGRIHELDRKSVDPINDLARNERFIGTVIAAVIFFCLGVRLIVKAIKNEHVNEHREENLGFKRFWRMAAVTSIYTLLTGIAFGFLETNLMVILIMIVCLTIAVVIMGTYTGYHFGFEHKRKAYVGGAILLWIAGFDVVFRYAMM